MEFAGTLIINMIKLILVIATACAMRMGLDRLFTQWAVLGKRQNNIFE